MPTKNSYPEKPEVPFHKTSVEMGSVIDYLKSLQIEKPIKCAAYVMFRNESGNGKSGINNNYCGFQGDSGRWPAQYDDKISGTCVKVENKTGKERRFLVFLSWQTSIDFLIDRVHARGLYVGGFAHLIAKTIVDSPATLATVYYKEWVTGNKNAVPDTTTVSNFLSMYKQADKLF